MSQPQPVKTSTPLGALWLSLRPRHWVKNAFVLAPLLFSKKIFQPSCMVSALGAAVAFCLAASAAYLVNDTLDRQRDKENPRTAHRPLASGVLSARLALLAAAALFALALFLASLVHALVPVASYVLGSTLYSLVLKGLPILDVASLASFYLLRLWAGSVAIDVPASPWLLTCGGLLALVTSWGKRLETGHPLYPMGVLRVGLSVLTAASFMSYLAYTLSPTARASFGWAMTLTLPWVGWALFRYWRQALAGKGDPITCFFSDRPLRTAALLWAATALVVVAHAVF